MRKTLLTGALASTAIRAFDNTTKTAAPAPAFTGGIASLAPPVSKSRRGSVSVYPFDKLTEVGQAFGVTNKTKQQLASVVSNANKRNMVKKTDASGNTVFKTTELTDPTTGAKTVVPTTEAEMIAAKRFAAYDVTDEYRKANGDAFKKGGAFEGATALIFRVDPNA